MMSGMPIFLQNEAMTGSSPLKEQQRNLNAMLRGHDAYYAEEPDALIALVRLWGRAALSRTPDGSSPLPTA